MVGWWRKGSLILGKGERIFFSQQLQDCLSFHPASCLVRTWAGFPLPNVISTLCQVKYAWNHTSWPHMFSRCGAKWSSWTESFEPSASGRLQILPSDKQERFAPLLTVPLRLSSDHWLFSRKSERQERARVFLLSFDFWYSVLVFWHSTQPPSGIPLARAESASSYFSYFFSEKGYADDRGMVRR